MPALPLDEAGKYVAGAYVVFVALILLYVAIMAAKLERIETELRVLRELAEDIQPDSREPEPLPDSRKRSSGSARDSSVGKGIAPGES